MKNVNAILCADLHIRATIPRCRMDDFLQTQKDKIKFIVELSMDFNCPIIVAGDLGENAQWPNWLLEWFIRLTRDAHIIVVPGQHDLPNHKVDLWRKSAVGVLHGAGAIDLCTSPELMEDTFGLFPFPYGSKISHTKTSGSPNIAVAHQMVIKGRPLWPGQKAPKAHALLHKFSEYDLILTGDNHHAFTYKMDGRWLVNPGSMTRHKADQINHKPRVYLWGADKNQIEEVKLPIKKDVIDRSHIDIIKIKEERMKDFTDKLSDDFDISSSFEINLKRALEQSKVRPLTTKKIKQAVGGDQWAEDM